VQQLQLRLRGQDTMCVNYHSDAEGASATAERCEAEGAKAIAVGANVSDRNAVKNLFRTCDELLGPIDCLVNNAGIIGGTSTLESLTEGALQATFATNLFGTIYCLQEAIERMASDRGGAGGSIVNMSSLAATLGSPGEYVHYAASKGAVETLTIGAGKELGSVGVRVNAIRVGTTATDIHAREGNPDRPGKVARATPLGRIAKPEDIADAAVWLASPMARFITGTILTVAGGIAP
jgi:NAD(P)-dependent dehydrogenase (short-subunit alcohol dehydrogenase family)